MIALTVVLAALWPCLWVQQHGSVSSLLVIGNEHAKDNAVLYRDFPHGYVFHNQGHDGGQFYVLAKHPFAFAANRPYLDFPAYRYRRIVYPLVAGTFGPDQGDGLVVALALTSLFGVALGAWALSRLPRAPLWLPLVMAFNPGVIAALFLSVADALVTGLVLAAFAVMMSENRRRVAIACALGVLACLTRETAVLATLSLALWPRLRRSERVALAVIPVACLGAWSLAAAHELTSSVFTLPKGGVVTLPIVGWFQGAASVGDRMLSLLVVAIVVAGGVTRRRLVLPVRAFLLATAAVLACSAQNVTYRSIDVTRVAAPAVPLAIWALTYRRSPAKRTPVAPEPVSRPHAAPA